MSKNEKYIFDEKLIRKTKEILLDENEILKIRHIVLECIFIGIKFLNEKSKTNDNDLNLSLNFLKMIGHQIFNILSSNSNLALRSLTYKVLMYIADYGFAEPKFYAAALFTFTQFANLRKIKLSQIFFETFTTKYIGVLDASFNQIIQNLANLNYNLLSISKSQKIQMKSNLVFYYQSVCKGKKKTANLFTNIFKLLNLHQVILSFENQIIRL